MKHKGCGCLIFFLYFLAYLVFCFCCPDGVIAFTVLWFVVIPLAAGALWLVVKLIVWLFKAIF